jgi:hypothetical protein
MSNFPTIEPSSSSPNARTIWAHAEELYSRWYGLATPWHKRSRQFREDLYRVASIRLTGQESS